MAEARISLSPYNYCQNNPILRIDPTGMLDDDYKLTQSGEIEFVQPTDSRTDELYATKTDGTIDKTKSVSVKKGTFDRKLASSSGNTTGITTENVEGAKSVYKFAADNNQKTDSNSGKEFGYIEYQEDGVSKAAVITDNKPNKVSASKIAKGMENSGAVVSEISHSHPSGNLPSGYSSNGQPKLNASGKYVGDAAGAAAYPNNSNGQPIIRTVYIPKTQMTISYDKNGLGSAMPSY